MAENSCFGAKKGCVGRVNFNLYHYAGNSPVKYTDPTGMFDLVEDSKTGIALWFNAATNIGDIASAKNVSDFMNDNPEFWGVIGGAGGVAGALCGIYSVCSPFKSFVDKSCNWIMDKNETLLSYGFDVPNLSWSYNNNDISKIKMNFEGSSAKNLKSDILFEKVFYKINEEKGNILKFNINFNISGKSCENDVSMSMSVVFNSKYKEKNYEEIISNFAF